MLVKSPVRIHQNGVLVGKIEPMYFVNINTPPSYAKGGTFQTHQEGGGERQEQEAPTGREIDLDFEVVLAT